MAEPLIVIGNGMAATKFAEELSARALGRYAVAVIGEEPRLAYNLNPSMGLFSSNSKKLPPMRLAYSLDLKSLRRTTTGLG